MNRQPAEIRHFVGSAPASGAGGRRFKSCRSEKDLGEVGQGIRSGIRSASPKTTPELVARFWSYVDKKGPEDCWVWTGGRSSCGYGNFKLLDRSNTPLSCGGREGAW